MTNTTLRLRKTARLAAALLRAYAAGLLLRALTPLAAGLGRAGRQPWTRAAGTAAVAAGSAAAVTFAGWHQGTPGTGWMVPCSVAGACLAVAGTVLVLAAPGRWAP